MPWMKRAREIFGRLVIFVDRLRAAPEVEARAKEVASVVHFSESAAFFASDFRAMIRACESDWVLFLDHDEELAAEWSRPEWRAVLRTTQFTHYFCPRRWILDNKNYIAAEPWWPDLQLRLFRSEAPSGFPSKPHEPVTVPGDAALLRNLAIHHHIWLADHSARQEKTKYYDDLLPGGALEYFYLYEQFHPRELAVPPSQTFDPQRDVITMARLAAEDLSAIELEAADLPRSIPPRKLIWSRAILHNRTAGALSSAPLFPVRISYHWRDAATGAMEVCEGLRTGFIDPIPAGEKREVEFVLLAPPRAGTFLLELTVVQENNFWFDQVRPDFARTFRIQVT